MLNVKKRSTIYAYSITICMGSFILGYNLTNINFLTDLLAQKQISVEWQHPQQSINLLKSILLLSTVFGVLLFKPLTNSWGFLTTFKIIDVVTIFGCMIGMIDISLSIQVISRILLGMAVGMNSILIPVYLTSVIPSSMGGPAGVLNQVFITLGLLGGFGFTYYAMNSSFGWRFVIGLPILPMLVRIYATQKVFPYDHLDRLIEMNNDASLRSYLNLVYQPVTLQDFKALKVIPKQDLQSQMANFFDPRGQSYKRRQFISVIIALSNGLSGASALGSWATQKSFPSLFGSHNILTSFIWLYLLQVIGTFFSTRYLDVWGRRAFMREGQRIIILSLLLIGFTQTVGINFYELTVPLVFLHMFGFSVGFGPCTFLIGTEIMMDITIPALSLWIGSFMFIFINKSMMSTYGIGPLCLLYSLIQICSYIYIESNLIESVGKSRQQVYKQFRQQCTVNRKIIQKEKSIIQFKNKNEIQVPLIQKESQFY